MMRRHVTMFLAFALPLAVSLSAVAQKTDAGAPAKTGVAAGGDAGASPTASAATGDGGAKAATAGDGGAATAATGTAATGSAAGTAGAAGTSGGASSPSPTPTGAGSEGATYAVRLRDLEARVDELKDQIRRSHTRLALLSDTILSGGAAGSRAEVTFRNEMSSAFRLTRALFVIDGTVQYNRQDESGALADQKEIPIFSGSIPPGDHTVQVVLNFQGNGYGVFTYLRGYKFEVKSSHAFTAVEGKTMTLAAIALEKGGVTTPLEQRPAIEWNEKVQALGAGAAAAPASGAAPGRSSGAGGSISIGGGK